MLIRNLFVKDISRPINGVVKADQLDEQAIFQELDEFVVTRELDGHLDRFFTRYCEALDGNEEQRADIGVWISGFFGSGKSHFIKVLSYLLANQTHRHDGTERQAVDFFEDKIEDGLLLANIKRAVAAHTDVILFNIDSKADNRAGREAILAVFLRVLNEMQGYCGDFPHVAHLERHLAGRGLLTTFHDAYRKVAGAEWVKERDAYEFHRDQVVEALSTTLGQSKESCEKWVDGAEDNFALTIENFAKWVREYLDSQGPEQRLIFLVDEVGQFIGTDGHLMLNLQTLTEELGTLCEGRAWIVVTSQEDIDAVVGEIGGSKANDFSKIQGRFKTRLSLSSANVDEVIQGRLLAKRPEAHEELERVFGKKGDVIKNQLTFKNTGMTFKSLRDAEDFARNYPFVPYQFQLLQKVFESIRKAGATGLHLAQGERSLLDAFQSAAKAVAGLEIGAAVPLYRFYPSIESFLDSSVKRTIDQSRENPSLEEFDTHILEVLFLIRYVDEMKGNLDNLVTLCLDQLDADRLSLRERIEASLRRLETESLISRNGDNYFFLTNEERDISREIKNTDLVSGQDTRFLAELIFQEVFGDRRKYRYPVNKKDFPINRFCDLHPFGNRQDGGLVVTAITPLADEYGTYQEGKCILESSEGDGKVLFKLPDDESLGRELRVYLKTEKFLKTKDDGTLPPSTKRIHQDLAEDNRGRRARLVALLENLLGEAEVYACGQRRQSQTTSPSAALDAALEYLIGNSFGKISYLEHLRDNPLPEIQAVLRREDVTQSALDLDGPTSNPKAIREVRDYIELATKTSQQILLGDLLEKRFGQRPFGWPEYETLLLLARLHAVGEIRFVLGGSLMPSDQVYEAITARNKWSKILIRQRVSTQPEDLQRARRLGKDLFAQMGPDGEEALYLFLHSKLQDQRSRLHEFKALVATGNYPGRDEIETGLDLVAPLLAIEDSNNFLARFLEQAEPLRGFVDPYFDLKNFFEKQKPTWEALRHAAQRFGQNRLQLDRYPEAQSGLERIQEILEDTQPYDRIHETQGLIEAVSKVNEELLAEERAQTHATLEEHLDAIAKDLSEVEAPDSFRNACLHPLESLRDRCANLESIPHLAQARAEGQRLKDHALSKIEEFASERAKTAAATDATKPPPLKPRRVIKPARFAKAVYLETEADIDRFLNDLREELAKAIADGARIEIR